jgi:hypothetical protein
MGANGPEADIQINNPHSPQEEVNPNRNTDIQLYRAPDRQHVAASSRPEEAMLITAIILACAYCFVAGQCYEFYSKGYPPVPAIKNLLLSLAWPGNVVAFLLMRCVR